MLTIVAPAESKDGLTAIDEVGTSVFILFHRFDPGEMFPESLQDRSHGVAPGPIGQLAGIVALVE